MEIKYPRYFRVRGRKKRGTHDNTHALEYSPGSGIIDKGDQRNGKEWRRMTKYGSHPVKRDGR